MPPSKIGHKFISPTRKSEILNTDISYASKARFAHKSTDDDGLSNEKLLEIFFNAIDELEKCRSKYDKLRVLGNMLKHVI